MDHISYSRLGPVKGGTAVRQGNDQDTRERPAVRRLQPVHAPSRQGLTKHLLLLAIALIAVNMHILDGHNEIHRQPTTRAKRCPIKT